MAIWAFWTAIMVVATLFYSISYKVNDLRFYVSAEKFKTSPLCLTIIRIGYFATIVTGILAIAYTSGTATLVYFNVALFFGLNYTTFKSFTDCPFENLQGLDLEKLDSEILICTVPDRLKSFENLFGLNMTSTSIIRNLEKALLKSYQKDPTSKKYIT